MRAQLLSRFASVTGAGLLALTGVAAGGTAAGSAAMAAEVHQATAAAGRAWQMTIYRGISYSRGITAGPDGASLPRSGSPAQGQA